MKSVANGGRLLRCFSKSCRYSSGERAYQNNQRFEGLQSEKCRFNSMNIQMLSKNLFDQIFPTNDRPSMKLESKDDENERRKNAMKILKSFGLGGDPPEILEEVEFQLPKLKGANINEHFENIAIEQCETYVKSILRMCKSGLPKKPKKWRREPGWSKYTENETAHDVTSVEFPPDEALIFDCEVLVTEGFTPVMAIAASATNWYSWCSPRIFELELQDPSVSSLIPLEGRANGSEQPDPSARIVVGHNVSYDRVRVKEQYYIEESGIRFLDTMSMHIAVSGFSNEQRVLYKSSGKNPDDSQSYTWLDAGCMNSLNDVHTFYCGKRLEKSARDIFIDGTIDDVLEHFDDLMEYCSNDVSATFNVLEKLFLKFCERFPHPVTMAAMLEMSLMYLPTNSNWQRFIKNSIRSYQDLDKEMKSTLMNLANNACELMHDEKYKDDPWLWNLNWEVTNTRLLKKPRKGVGPFEYNEQPTVDSFNAFEKLDAEERNCVNIGNDYLSYKPSSLMQSVLNTSVLLPKVEKHLPGYPKWYTELCMKQREENWKPGPVKLSTLTKISPKLLRMTWNGYVLHHDMSTGWGCLVPDHENLDNINGNGVDSIPSLDDEMDADLAASMKESMSHMGIFVDLPDIPKGYRFFKLPHKSGSEYNVGSPLSHEFLSKMDNGTLKSAHEEGANRCLEINLASSYWRLSRKRIFSQIFLNLPDDHVPSSIKSHPDFIQGDLGIIIPLTVVFGTITRRGVEPTWLTASNVRLKSIGSELKAMIQAPPGHTFVGADVDSQELWIASLLGDSDSVKEHGCTPISWMTLQGTKSKGTDLHSKTADSIGISRDEAKVFNYARIYGSGERATKQMLKRYQPGLSEKEASQKVRKLYDMTKGKRRYLLSTDGRYYASKLKANVSREAVLGGKASYDEVQQLTAAAKAAYGHLISINERDLVAGRVWEGGMESEMFNKLEKIALSMKPCTPFLGSRISSTMEPSKVQHRYLPTRMNWVVQSSAVDYMHLMLVCMRWLINTYSIKARFSISIHDELRYMCEEEDRYRTALALQIANLLTRAMFAYQLGMKDLPLSVAFFSSVEIDKTLRKHHLDDCVTPSNPLGLKVSCGIGPGDSLSIHDILDKTGGGKLNMQYAEELTSP